MSKALLNILKTGSLALNVFTCQAYFDNRQVKD